SCWRLATRAPRSAGLWPSADRGSITFASRSTTWMRRWSDVVAPVFSLSTKNRALAPKESESHFCTPNQPVGCWSSSQITRRAALSTGRPRVATKIADGGEIHVLDVPAVARSLDRVESRLPNEVPFLELDADIATSAA